MPSTATTEAEGPEPAAAAAAPIGVVIVSWNVRDLLRACLASLGEAGRPTRVVVVDNASSDGSAAMLRAEFPAVGLIANTDNRGFTAANNQGFRALGLRLGDETAGGLDATRPGRVLILNPDAELAPGALDDLAECLDRHPEAAAAGPRLVYGDGAPQESRRRFPGLWTGILEATPWAWHWPDNPVARRYHMRDVPPELPGRVDWLSGAAILFRSEALEAADGFDEGFFMYSEELDLCRRLRDLGWSVRYCPAARVTHHEGRSSAQVVDARHRHFQRSRIRYYRKHHGRGAAAFVRAGVLAGFAAEWCLEALKWLLGHRRALRRARMRAYAALLADGLGPTRGAGPKGGAEPGGGPAPSIGA